MRQLMAAVALLGCLATGCGEKSPSVPTPPPINLTGTWAGNVTVLGTSARMLWSLTQSDSTVTGPVALTLPSGTVLLNGFLTGALNGNALTYTIAVGPGGVPTQPACAGQLGGTMNASIGVVSTLVGRTSLVSSNCAPPLPSGDITLTKQ